LARTRRLTQATETRCRSAAGLVHAAWGCITKGDYRKAIIPMTLLEQYIAGWRAHDVAAILATLTPNCVVIESFGPIYRGHDWVARWVSIWRAEDGNVIDWTIHNLRSSSEGETAEWTFHYKWRGAEKSFDGSTIATLHDEKISYLREYATNAVLYDWQGEWQPL
jgi:ketosteroid isomerase-like protein